MAGERYAGRVDIVSVKRITEVLEAQGERFLDRIFTPGERTICGSDSRRLAGRFAAKEAVAKALGTGIGREGIAFSDIEIGRDELGAPWLSRMGRPAGVLTTWAARGSPSASPTNTTTPWPLCPPDRRDGGGSGSWLMGRAGRTGRQVRQGPTR